MWPFRKKEVKPDRIEVAISAIRAMPVTINPTQAQSIDRAKYRLDAMWRHTAQRGDRMGEQRLAEFRREARVHIANLMAVSEMDEDEAKVWARRFDL